MPEIQLPGYRSVIQNMVFARDEYGLCKKCDTEHPIRHLVLPQTLTRSNDNALFGYVQSVAKKILSSGIPTRYATDDMSNVEKSVAALPDNMIKEIAEGYGVAVDSFRALSPIAKHDQNETFLIVRYGSMPFDESIDPEMLADPDFYKQLFLNKEVEEDSYGQKWQAYIRLCKHHLPKQDDIKTLIKHGTHESRTLVISDPDYSIDEVSGVVRALYTGLRNPSLIKELPDISEDILKSTAESMVINLYMAMMKRTVTDIASVVMGHIAETTDRTKQYPLN